MGKLSSILRNATDGRLTWWCPGCDQAHQVKARIRQAPVIEPDPDVPDWTPPPEYYEASDGAWAWNGSVTKPTFQPSVLVTGRGFTAKGRADFNAWHAAGCPPAKDGAPLQFESAPSICHCFVVNGQMQMLNDCTHTLAGQTVPIPPWPRPDWCGV